MISITVPSGARTWHHAASPCARPRSGTDRPLGHQSGRGFELGDAAGRRPARSYRLRPPRSSVGVAVELGVRHRAGTRWPDRSRSDLEARCSLSYEATISANRAVIGPRRSRHRMVPIRRRLTRRRSTRPERPSFGLRGPVIRRARSIASATHRSRRHADLRPRELLEFLDFWNAVGTPSGSWTSGRTSSRAGVERRRRRSPRPASPRSPDSAVRHSPYSKSSPSSQSVQRAESLISPGRSQ